MTPGWVFVSQAWGSGSALLARQTHSHHLGPPFVSLKKGGKEEKGRNGSAYRPPKGTVDLRRLGLGLGMPAAPWVAPCLSDLQLLVHPWGRWDPYPRQKEAQGGLALGRGVWQRKGSRKVLLLLFYFGRRMLYKKGGRGERV